MYKAVFDKQGNRTATYVEGVHNNIPPEAIEITKEEQDLYCTDSYIRGADGKPVRKPPYVPTAEMMLAAIRAERNRLLTESDWTDTLSAKSRLGEEKYNQWQEYRQALRDMPEACDINNPAWPIKPE